MKINFGSLKKYVLCFYYVTDTGHAMVSQGKQTFCPCRLYDQATDYDDYY